MNQELIAKNIEQLRIKNGMKQDEFAKRLIVSRPTVSNWEQGKAMPTTDQLMKIAQEFHVSIDELLGLKQKQKIMFILDSSILLRRPKILDDMEKKNIQYICITETVLSELNYQKDKGKRKQQAWLAMKSFKELQDKDKNRFKVLLESGNESLNDNKIINAAMNQAKKDLSNMVYLVSNDIYFPLKTQKLSNLETLTLDDYEKKFSATENDYDEKATGDFFAAVLEKNMEKAKSIYEKNPDVNHTDPKTGFTPCIQAVRNKDKSMLEWLLSLPDLDMNKCDDVKYRLPPISHAVQMNNLDFIKLLLKYGADIDKGSQGTNYGNTALMIASWHGRLDIVTYLVEQGACCNQQDSNGFTPLIKACIKKHVEVAKFLFDKTDKNIRSRNDYMTARDYALKSKNTDLIYIFERGGAK